MDDIEETDEEKEINEEKAIKIGRRYWGWIEIFSLQELLAF